MSYILYFFKLKDKTYVKEKFFSFVSFFDDIDKIVDEFWSINKKKIKQFYLDLDHSNDIIISASPYFLLYPLVMKLKVKDLIASEVSKKTGKFEKKNCKGIMKVEYLKNKYKNIRILSVYTDSYSDAPLMEIAESAYLVKKNKIIKIK